MNLSEIKKELHKPEYDFLKQNNHLNSNIILNRIVRNPISFS